MLKIFVEKCWKITNFYQKWLQIPQILPNVRNHQKITSDLHKNFVTNWSPEITDLVINHQTWQHWNLLRIYFVNKTTTKLENFSENWKWEQKSVDVDIWARKVLIWIKNQAPPFCRLQKWKSFEIRHDKKFCRKNKKERKRVQHNHKWNPF